MSDLTKQEQFQENLISSWKTILKVVNCGDSAKQREVLAAPVLDFLEEQIKQFGLTPSRHEHLILEREAVAPAPPINPAPVILEPNIPAFKVATPPPAKEEPPLLVPEPPKEEAKA